MKINVSDEQLALLAQMGDRKAAELLMNKYKGLVSAKCKRFYIAGGTNDDILQEGMIGLYRAIMSFDYDKNDSFAAFAAICIRRKLISAMKSANRQKNAPLNTSISLEKPIGGGEDGCTLGDTLEQKGVDPEEIFLHREKQKSTCKRLAGALSPFEKRVLHEYLTCKSYEQIAQSMGITLKSVDNAVQRIRHKIKRIT